MKKTAKKLTLNRQTLRQLDSLDKVGEVAGGFQLTHTCSFGNTCPATYCVCPQPTAQCTNGLC